MLPPKFNVPKNADAIFALMHSVKHKLPGKRVMMMLCGGVFGLLLLWALLLMLLFSEDSARAELQAALKQYFGREVTINGASQFSLFPSPELVVYDVSVANHPRSSQPNMVSIPKLSIALDSFSALFGQETASVTINNPKIVLENFDNGEASWSHEKTAEADSSVLLLNEIHVLNAMVQYRYPAKNREWQVSNIESHMKFASAQDVKAQGSMVWGGIPYQFYANIEEGSAKNIDIKAGITDGNAELHTEGVWDGKTHQYSGKQRAVFADLGKFLESFTEDLTPKEAKADKTKKELPAAIPLKWEGEVDFEAASQKLTLKQAKIKGEGVEGNADAVMIIAAEPDISLSLQMKKLSLAALEKRGVFRKLLTQRELSKTMDGATINAMGGKIRGLPHGIKIDTTIIAEKAEISGIPVQNMQISAKLENAAITIPQLSGQIEGEGQFILKGVVDSSFEGLALKGQLDFGGKEFGKAVRLFAGEDVIAPERLKAYRGRGNLFFTKDILRMSELILRSEDLQILGTVLRKKNNEKSLPAQNAGLEAPRVEYFYDAALRIDRLNLDEWHKAQQDPEDETLKDYPKLLRLAKVWQEQSRHTESQIKISFVDLILNGKARGKASLSMAINGGGVAFNRFELPYNGTFVSGAASIGFPQKTIPLVSVDIKADILNTSEFFEHDFSKDESFWRDEKGDWSRKEFNLEWMHRFNGKLKLEASHVTHDVYELNDLTLEGNLQDGLGQISKLSAQMLGGNLSFRGQLTASKLPAMSCNISLSNSTFEKLKVVTEMVGDLTGKLSMSGEFSSTGINPQILVQNAQGAIAVAGAGITVKGFNLENLTRAANTVRTVADIKKLVDYADQGGATYIDSLKGNVVLGGGFLRSPGVLIATKEGSGSMNGQLGLTDWDLSGAITLYLTVLQPQSPPSIRLVFAGPLHQAVRTLETQSLESFIAKQSAERILDTQ